MALCGTFYDKAAALLMVVIGDSLQPALIAVLIPALYKDAYGIVRCRIRTT